MKIGDGIGIVDELIGRGKSIRDSTANNYSDVNDRIRFERLLEKMRALRLILFTEFFFGKALFVEMHALKTSEHDEKIWLPVEKAFDRFLDEILFPHIEGLIKISTSWTFTDSRIRNFQNELRRQLETLRAHYKEHYEL